MSGGADDSHLSERKKNYYAKMSKLLSEYNRILVVTVDNVGSSHMQSIRKSVRGKGVILMGKNTLMRKAMREYATKVNNGIEPLITLIYGNVGMVFVKEDLQEVKNLLVNNTVGAYAKVGSFSPTEVIVPKGDTGMDPSKTSFFQALSIQTKINKGKIEILNDVALLHKGDKVGASQATLLQMLNIKPFLYGCKVQTIYDNGQVIPPALFDMNDREVLDKVARGIQRIAAISLQIGHPTIASIPHTMAHGYRNLVSIALATNFSFKQVEQLKALLSDPEALKRAQAAAAGSAPAQGGSAPAAGGSAPAKDEKKKPAADDDDEAGGGGMGGLFGDDDDGGGGGMGGLFGDAEEDS
jgi:large subunit ribosomal protein LP0